MNSADLQYYRKINGISEKQSYKGLLISEMTQDYNNARENAIYRFDVLINTIDAKDVYVNNSETTIKGIIDTSKKQTADTEIEQTIQVYPNQIKRGDYIKFKMNNTDELRTYLVKSKVDKKSSCDEAVFEECNHLFKWMKDGTYHEAWGIGTDQTKYTLGVSAQSSAGILEADARYSILFPNDSICKSVGVGTRFLFNDGAWKVTKIEYVSTQDNLRSLLLAQDSINYEIDDIQEEIAEKWLVNHTYTYDIPTSFEVSEDSDYTLVYSIKDETGKDVDYNLVTISTTDTSLVQLTNTNGVITIKGLSAGIGSVKLVATLSSETKEFDIAFEVKETVVNQVNYQYSFSQPITGLKQYVTTTLTTSKFVNGIADSSL